MSKAVDRDVKKLVNSLRADTKTGLKTLLVSLDTAESWERELKENGYIIASIEEVKTIKKINFI
jgi:hypothetical protein